MRALVYSPVLRTGPRRAACKHVRVWGLLFEQGRVRGPADESARPVAE